MKKILIGCLSILFSMVVIAIGSYIYLKSGENKAFVRDDHQNRELIEYYHVDLNTLQLAIKEDGRKKYIKHPACCLNYKIAILENELVFDRDDSGYILLNGESFKIEYLD